MRFLQVVQAHPDARGLSELQIYQGFAEAVTAVVYLERGPRYGQVVREIVEVQPMVERVAARPSFLPCSASTRDGGSSCRPAIVRATPKAAHKSSALM